MGAKTRHLQLSICNREDAEMDAISVGEVVNPKTKQRYELQLKGGGQTPFCRGADGRQYFARAFGNS